MGEKIDKIVVSNTPILLSFFTVNPLLRNVNYFWEMFFWNLCWFKIKLGSHACKSELAFTSLLNLQFTSSVPPLALHGELSRQTVDIYLFISKISLNTMDSSVTSVFCHVSEGSALSLTTDSLVWTLPVRGKFCLHAAVYINSSSNSAALWEPVWLTL